MVDLSFRLGDHGRYPAQRNHFPMTAVFCALIEVKLLDGCEFDLRDNAGAAVRCYIPAASAELAMKMLSDELRHMKMDLVETEWCVDYEDTDWDKPADPAELELVAESRRTRDILFGVCLLYTSPSPRDRQKSRMPSSA